jgi:thymidylate kinase
MTYKTAKKIAASGKIVICDRFPLPQIKFMDGPQVSRMTVNLRQTKLLKYLIHLEESYYSKITPPDILVLLRVDPSIACHRKTTEIEEEVFNRSKEMWEIDWRQTPAIVIDANRSSGEVLSEIKELVWSRL